MGIAESIALDEASRLRPLTDAESIALEGHGRNRIPTRKPADQPAHYVRWDDATDAEMLKARKAKVRAADIAQRIGRTRGAVYERLNQLRKLSGVNARNGRKRIRAREKEAGV